MKTVISPKQKDLGDNFVVRRSLPHIDQRMVGPFIFWDHMGPVELTKDRQMTVRAHPHIGLATITYLFDGEIWHRDSLGNELPIRPGEVNWMTAGNGIAHSERTNSDNAPETLEGIQLWIALPPEHEEVGPSFSHFKAGNLPLFHHEGAELHLIAGEMLGKSSPVEVFNKMFYLNARVKEEQEFTLPIAPESEGAIYVTKGEIEVNKTTYPKYTMITFNQGENISCHLKEGSEFMIFGGEVFEQKPHLWWNFVSYDKDKIEAAKERWKSGNYPPVINETDRIPLPEK